MVRFVGERKYCINDKHSVELNRQTKEADILKQAAEILGVSKADASSVCLKNYCTNEGSERRVSRFKYSCT
jgi:hypothetical protein